MIEPPPARSSAGMPYLQPKKTPFRFTPMTRSKVPSSVSSTEPSSSGKMPALLNSTCSAPNCCSANAIMSATSAARATSARTNAAVPPPAPTCSTVARPAAASKSAATTRAPSAANRSAVARPMPPPAPVISATLFSRRRGIRLLLICRLGVARAAFETDPNQQINKSTQSTIGIDRCPDEGTKDALLRHVLELHLRVPLHADAPGMLDVLDRLDQTVLSPRHRAQALADAIDALMMPGAHLGVGRAEDVCQAALRLDLDAVHADVARVQSMRDAVAVVVRQMDVQAAATDDVQHLQAAADTQHRHARVGERRAREREFERIALLADGVHAFMVLAAVGIRIDVAAARDDQRAHARQQSGGLRLAGWKDDRHAAGAPHGVDVAGRNRERGRFAGASIRGHADERERGGAGCRTRSGKRFSGHTRLCDTPCSPVMRSSCALQIASPFPGGDGLVELA